MSKLNQERSAFPVAADNYQRPGLTKLEYFAGLAMQGLLVNYGDSSKTIPLENFPDAETDTRLTVAALAVIAAKSLLAELEKESKQ